MIEPGDSLRNARDRWTVGDGRSCEQQNGDAQRSGRGNLAVGGRTATVFRNDGVNGMSHQQLPIMDCREWTAREQIVSMRHRERRIDGIDTSHEVVMLGRGAEGLELLSPDRQENAARIGSQRANRLLCARNIDPDVCVRGNPRGPAHGEDGNSGLLRGFDRIPGNDSGVRMGRIDQYIDALTADVIGESIGAAESPAPHRNRLSSRRRCAPRERHRRVQIAAGQRECQLAGLRRTSQNQSVRAHVSPSP